MNCNRARRLASLELDEGLTARDVLRLREHLAGCAACSAFHHDLHRIVHGARTLGRERAPDGFAETVNRRIVESRLAINQQPWPSPAPVSFGKAMRILGAAAACVALVGAGIHYATIAGEARAEAARTLETATSQEIALAAFNPLDDVTVVHLAGMASLERRPTDDN